MGIDLEQAMDTIDLKEIADQGVIGMIFAVFILSLVRGWIVVGFQYNSMIEEKNKQIEDLEEERNMYRELAFRGTELAEGAVRKIQPAGRRRR